MSGSGAVQAEQRSISTIDDYMDKMALMSNWGARDNVSIAKIPAGTKIKYAIGTAKEQVGAIESRPGGGLQILFEQFDDSWVIETRTLPQKEGNMNKYEILENKLIKISKHINEIQLENEAAMNYLKQYKEYVDRLIIAVQKRTIRNSNGAVLGLIKGISDYDEICVDDVLWNLVTDADNYYCNECKQF